MNENNTNNPMNEEIDETTPAAPSENMENINEQDVIDKKSQKGKKASAAKSKLKKPARIALRVAILVVLFCVVLFAGIIVSDVLFGKDSEPVPEFITITVSGDTIDVADKGEVTIPELKAYLDSIYSKDKDMTVALINDTSNPADPEVYNQVVELLARYGVICETMPVSTEDELSVATFDER